MRVVIQRVTDAAVSVDGQCVAGFNEPGLVVLVGVTHDDGPADVAKVVNKVAQLRIFAGEQSAVSIEAPVLVVSQFTLFGDIRKGRRPSWGDAAPRAIAEPLVDAVVQGLAAEGLTVQSGVFGADMQVSLTNDGPMTIWFDTAQTVA